MKKVTTSKVNKKPVKSKKMSSFENNLEDWLDTPKKEEVSKSSTRSTVEDYFAYPAVNNSLLNMLSNPIWIRWKEENRLTEDEEKTHFRVGSAIDVMLTDPDSFDKQFFVANTSKPGGYMGIFIDNLPLNLDENSDLEAFRKAYQKSKYKTKIESIVSNLFTKDINLNYYKARHLSQGKSILSSEDMEEVTNAVKHILQNKIIAYFFSNKYDEGRNIERLFQKAIYFQYKQGSTTISCKGLLDLIIIDHDKKEIQPCDLKSIATNIYEFEPKFYNHNYFRQCAFYHMAVEYWLQNDAPVEIRNYKVLPFKFIVTPKSDNGYPALIFNVSEQTLNAGLDGTTYNGKWYPGLFKLLADYAWHKEMNFWDVPKDIYESGYSKTL